MVRKILVSLSDEDRGLVTQNVVRNRRSHKNSLEDARTKRRLEIGVNIPTPSEVRNIIARLDSGRDRAMLMAAIFTGFRAASCTCASARS
jgi:hypothetical protein